MRSERRAILATCLAVVLVGGSATAEVIDFEGILPGTIVDEVFGDGGSGPIGVNAVNVDLDALFAGPNNAAVIFNSSDPPGIDFDLGTPNEAFGGPGVSSDGSGVTNTDALGNLLIINEADEFNDDDTSGSIDGNDSVNVTDDADNADAPITFDFSGIGPVTVSAMDLIDIEQIEGPGSVTFVRDGLPNVEFVLPVPGDNGVASVDLGPTDGVLEMIVVLGGSGAIDNIEFETPQGGGDGCTPGYWKQRHHFDSWVAFDPSDDFETVFGVDASFTTTLLGALRQGGGGAKALGRHAVAALLNSTNGDVGYDFSTAEVIAIVQGAFATGDFNGAKDILEGLNELGCPLN